jgi:hypothetical protein
VELRQASEDWKPLEKKDWDKRYHDLYSNAVMVSSSSKLYNCHSYAWYSKDIATNNVCMSDPSPYWIDGSYRESKIPVQNGIVFYASDSVEKNHSALLVGDPSGTGYESKWGPMPLMRHSLDDCPYSSIKSGNIIDIHYYAGS